LGLRLTLRSDHHPEIATNGGIFVSEGRSLRLALVVSPLLYVEDLADEPKWEIVAQWLGSLGQRVVEHYEWDFAEAIRDLGRTENRASWRLARFEIVPSVEGADGHELRFDP
jgi:hypothetical protein